MILLVCFYLYWYDPNTDPNTLTDQCYFIKSADDIVCTFVMGSWYQFTDGTPDFQDSVIGIFTSLPEKVACSQHCDAN